MTSPLEYTNEEYAIAKIAGLKMCESYNLQYGTNYIAVMPTNLYGPNDNFHLENSHVMPAMMRKVYLAKLIHDGAWDKIAIDMNKQIFDYGMEHNAPLGTTAVVFIVLGNEYVIMNIGDSRAYMFTGDEMALLTHDQSVIQDMIDRGMMTPEEAEDSPQKSVLLQCVGASDSVSPQFVRGEIKEDSSIVLCSDGFWRKLKKEEMIDALKPANCSDEGDMKKKLDELVELVKSRKETDNISAVLMNCMDKKE